MEFLGNVIWSLRINSYGKSGTRKRLIIYSLSFKGFDVQASSCIMHGDCIFHSDKDTQKTLSSLSLTELWRHFYSWISTSFGENLYANCDSLVTGSSI